MTISNVQADQGLNAPLPGERGKHNRDMVLPQRGVRVSTSHGITYKSQHHGGMYIGGEGEGEERGRGRVRQLYSCMGIHIA